MIRRAGPEDAAAIAHLHVRSWQTTYRGILPDALLDGLDLGERTEVRRKLLQNEGQAPVRNWVYEEEGQVVGWAALGPCRDEDLGPEVVELYAIYLLPEVVGRGIGRRLMTHCLHEARAAGRSEMTLWVLVGNDRAARFYEAAGFALDGRAPEAPHGNTGARKRRMCRDLA